MTAWATPTVLRATRYRWVPASWPLPTPSRRSRQTGHTAAAAPPQTPSKSSFQVLAVTGTLNWWSYGGRWPQKP